MTDRIAAITVHLDEEIREDDPELKNILGAIRQIKGVHTVEPHKHGLEFSMAESSARAKARRALIDAAVEAANNI